MRVSRKAIAVLGLAVATVSVGAAVADGRHHRPEIVRATLVGYEEVPSSLSTPGRGRFRAVIDEDAQTIRYRLSYSGLEAPVIQAHIHFGQRHTVGGVSVFLCTNAGNGPMGTPACPTGDGEVTGELTAASVVGPAAQGIAAGEFAELIAAIRTGNAYANVHSQLYPAGEIRGQITGD
jgi:hypothetical protein